MRILRLTKSRRGAGNVEYAVLLGLIAVVAVMAVQQVGGAISGLTNSTAGKIQEATAQPPAEPDIPAGTLVLFRGACPSGYTEDPAAAMHAYDSEDKLLFRRTAGLTAVWTQPGTQVCRANSDTMLSGEVIATNGASITFVDYWGGTHSNIGTAGWRQADGGPTPAGGTAVMIGCPAGWSQVSYHSTYDFFVLDSPMSLIAASNATVFCEKS